MNTFIFILFVLALVSSFRGYSEGEDSGKVLGTYGLNLKASYNSFLIYPGERLGVEFPVNVFKTTIINRSGKR
jgi:hypothetical protein